MYAVNRLVETRKILGRDGDGMMNAYPEITTKCSSNQGRVCRARHFLKSIDCMAIDPNSHKRKHGKTEQPASSSVSITRNPDRENAKSFDVKAISPVERKCVTRSKSFREQANKPRHANLSRTGIQGSKNHRPDGDIPGLVETGSPSIPIP